MMHGMMMGFPGILFWAAGIGLLIGGVTLLFRRGTSERRSLEDPGGTTVAERSIRRRVFALAKQNHGVLTVSDVVADTGISPTEAEEMLNDLADGMHVTVEVTDRGSMEYRFPDIRQKSE